MIRPMLAGTLALIALFSDSVFAQPFGPPPPVPPRPPREGAPVDFTGQWVSVINEDWRWRMVTPLKGDFASIPLSPRGRELGEQWDPAKDEAAGQACKGYGAPAIMREPGRVRISWQDDTTLKLELDAGTQTRLLHFGPPPDTGTAPSLQGYSQASWEEGPGGRVGGLALGVGPRGGTTSNTLKVVTTHITPGYLRKNGIPFGESAKMTEYFDRFEEPDGTEWFVITSVIEDPTYLSGPWVTSLNFKKEQDRSKWRPTPCSAT